MFIRDSGLAHGLLDLHDYNALTGGALLGASWESYVIQQIVSRSAMNVTPYYYRTRNGAELDLVLVKGGQPVATIEIRYTNAPSLKRGNTEAIADLQTTQNYILTPEASDYWLRTDVKVCSITSVRAELDALRLLGEQPSARLLTPMQSGVGTRAGQRHSRGSAPGPPVGPVATFGRGAWHPTGPISATAPENPSRGGQ